jgi:hypothetical protein
MTKQEIIKALETTPDNEEVYISCNGVFPIMCIERGDGNADGDLYLVADEDSEIYYNGE